MLKTELTDRQRDVLAYIVAFRREHGFSPTIREIGKHFGIRGPNGVRGHLEALERKGALTRVEGTSRSMIPVTDGACPFCGK